MLKVRMEGDDAIPLPYDYEMKIDGKKFFTWVDNVMVIHGDRIAHFSMGRIKGNSAAVILGRAWNVDLAPPLPLDYPKDKSLFQTRDVILDKITIPIDCTPRYDPPTPKKKQMLEAVVGRVEEHLNWYKKHGTKYPKHVTVVIANFNVDYPYTFILFEQPRQLYSVTLHNLQDYDNDQYERERYYPMGNIVIDPSRNWLVAKIRKHGIRRKIVLKP